MITFDKKNALLVLTATLKGIKHKNYDRTVALAEKYLALNTGEDIEKLLRQFELRESESLFKQRVLLTKSVVGAVSEKIMNPFYKVARSTNVTKEIIYKSDDTGSKMTKLEDKLSEFYGDESFNDYLESQLVTLSFIDPNSFIVIERNFIEGETSEIFPFEVPSENAYDYKYINNRLIYLVVGDSSIVPNLNQDLDKKNETFESKKQTIYSKDFTVVLSQIQKEELSSDIERIDDFDSASELANQTYIVINKEYYIVWVVKNECEEVPAISVGYKRDPITGNKSFVSPMHKAVPRMEKSIKSDSELDLTMSLHTFPQKLQAVQRCTGTINAPCDNGISRHSNEKCPVCKGSGEIIATSSQEVITVPMPTKKERENGADFIDLDKILTYKAPPIDLVIFQNDYSRSLEKEAVKDVFSSDAFEMGQATATEKIIDMESVYDTLYPFGKKYSSIYKKIVRISACYLQIKDLTVRHSFPKDLKLKTTTQLIAELKEAEDANAPQFFKSQLSNDIANKIWHDDKISLNKYNVKQQHQPFQGKSKEEISQIINAGLSTEENITLFIEFENIFKKLEDRSIDNEMKSFYELPYSERVTLIDAEVKSVIDKKTSESTSFLNIEGEDLNPEDIETPIDIEAEAKAKLKGSVGGVQGIINVAQSVSSGSMSFESGVALLVLIYGLEDADAKKLLISPPKV